MKKHQHITTGILLMAAGPACAASSIPQMNPASYPGQLVWLGISFVLLYLMVANFIAPRVSAVLDERARAITDAIAKAEELKAKASNTRGDFEAAGAKARTEAAALIAKAQADAAKKAAEANAALSAELEAKAAESRTRIAKAVAKANAEVDDAAQELADAMTRQLLSGSPAVTRTKKAS